LNTYYYNINNITYTVAHCYFHSYMQPEDV